MIIVSFDQECMPGSIRNACPVASLWRTRSVVAQNFVTSVGVPTFDLWECLLSSRSEFKFQTTMQYQGYPGGFQPQQGGYAQQQPAYGQQQQYAPQQQAYNYHQQVNVHL
jgi:hypothetical protein